MESASSGTATVEVHKRIRKVKKKGARPRDGEAPSIIPSHTKLHQLLLEERIENGYSDPARLVKLKKRQLNGSAVEAKDGKSYMEKFLETPSPDRKMVCETSIIPLPEKLMLDDICETGIKILEVSSISHVKKSLGNERTSLSPNEQELELKPFSEVDGQTNEELVKVHEQIYAGVTEKTPSIHPKLPDETKLAVNDQEKIDGSLDGYHSDDVTSEVDNYMDALTTMESELETDNEFRPKKSFVNIQKVTDRDGKEEQQTQTQFSDSQSSVDSSTSDEISSFKQARNEEHTEVQAQLSDSQSTGTSSTSDDNSSFRRDGNEHRELQPQFSDSQSIANSFASDENSYFEKDRSYVTPSDSLSTVVENIQSEPILFTSTKNYEADVENRPSDQPPQIVELQKTDCSKFVMHDDAPVHQETTSDSGQASSGSCLMNSGLVLCSDPGLASPVTLPTGTQLDETPSDPLELNLRLDDDEDRMGLVESMAAEPVSLSLAKGDACPVDSSEKNSLDNLDDGDPCVHFDDQLQVSNNIELAHEDESSDHSETKALLAESPNENSSRILVGRDIDSQGEGDICQSMEELDLNSGTMLLPDSRDSKDEDCIVATQLNSEDLSPIVEIPPVSCFTGELSSDLTHDNQQDEPESAEIEVLYSDLQSNFEEIPRMVHGDEISGSTCSFDPVEDYGHLKHPSSLDYRRRDNHVTVNDVVAENVQSEDQAVVTVPSADGRDPKDEDCIIATRPNSEDLSPVVEIPPVSCFTGDLSSDLTHDNPSADSAENDASIVSCPASGLICSSSSNLANLQEPLTGSSDSHQMEMGSNEVELTEISRDLNAQKRENQLEPVIDITSSDIIYSPMSNLTKLEESLSTFADHHEKDMEVNEAVARESLTEIEAQEMVDQPEIASTDVQLNLNRSAACDLSDSEIYNSIQNSSPKEQFRYCATVDDVKMVPEFSGLDTGRSESILLGQNDLSQNGKDSLPSPSCNQVESEIHSERFLQSQVSEHGVEFVLRGEENLAPEKFWSQQRQIFQLEKESSHATSEFAPEIYPDESSSSYSSYSLSQTSGQEVNPTKHVMDPLKPLLHDFFPKATENNLDEMPPMPPLPPMQWRMGKVQHASLVSQREVEVSQASFQPMLLIKPDEKSQFGLPISERDPLLYQGPGLPVTAVESDKLQHSSGLSVGVSGHSVAIPFQFAIMLNAANGQYNYVLLDRTQIQSPFLTLPVASTGMPPYGYVVASEGEMVQNSNPCPPIPPTECTVSGHDSICPQEKQTQPPSQLMTETSSEFKTLKQSVSNVEGEQVDHSISPMPLPSMESIEPNQNLLHSEGEMASSSDTSAQTSDFESEWPNGKPKNKLRRPRNPLIDAVAAHDKSKLRKVTERVRPQIAPKVDERDSLLEQIRTKSFNLKPAVATRPSIQGPKTNLKVAAILEKANAIRQALAGSDEDDDADSWSDS